MISEAALNEFKQIWQSEFGEDIPNETAVDEAINLLSLFDAVYRPIKQEWDDEYLQKVKKNQPARAKL
jgi:hypothetical protein